jgi:hypothetical protein
LFFFSRVIIYEKGALPSQQFIKLSYIYSVKYLIPKKMKILPYVVIVVAAMLFSGCKKQEVNVNYKGNPEPLYRNSYIRLPLGTVKPAGWLKRQLEIEASGLTGHLDDFWPDLSRSAWKGEDGDGWERGPYYLDGLVPLAYLTDDEKLKAKVKEWIEPIISSSIDSGWYGPAKNHDRWPRSVSNKVLMQYYEATGDQRAFDVLMKYFRYIHDTRPDWPHQTWRGVRAMENAVTGYWLYRQTGEPWILETLRSIQENAADWTGYYEKFPWDSAAAVNKTVPHDGSPAGMTAHGVNNAMAIKYPGLWYQQSKDPRYMEAVFQGIKKYDFNHGQAGGRFSCDEHLSGNSPVQGTEVCSIVEYMYSLEELYAIFGDVRLADRLELLAYNGLPGTTTPDFWAHQYDQQANQVLVSVAKRDWSSNDDYSNLYGFMPNFGCCLANMHQGWPKFVESLWMATNDNGLAIAAYGPSVVKALVGKGKEVTISEETDYPFRGTVKLTINTSGPVRFPIYLRKPVWADSIIVNVRDETLVFRGETGEIRLNERWRDGDQVYITIPMKLRSERRYNNSLVLMRGPLCFALRIDKEYRSIRANYENYSYLGTVDWEIYPKSPWNYGLLVDPNNLERGNRVVESPVTEYPFADRGDMIWSADSGKYIAWTQDAPVSITARGIKIPGWTMKNNSADVPPLSPVKPEGDPEIITLVPYGCAKLRITEFPVMDITLMEEVIKPAR